MSWKKDLKKEIERNNFDLGIFTLQELYRLSYNNLAMKSVLIIIQSKLVFKGLYKI